MRRIYVSARMQWMGVAIAFTAVVGALLSIGQIAVSAANISIAASALADRYADRAAHHQRESAMRDELVALKAATQAEVLRLEARQAFLASVLAGEGDTEKLASLIPAPGKATSHSMRDLLTLFGKVDGEQQLFAARVKLLADSRLAETLGVVSKLGIATVSSGGMGGPYEPVPAGAAVIASQPVGVAAPDPQFRALFNSWKRLEQAETTLVAIPSERPVQNVTLTSGFGVRSDPFRRGRAMHAGVDIPGAIGTPIYATADAIVGRTGLVGGYGNMIELEHGKGIQTRYGHLSSILVVPGSKVKRGQQIGLMGSTGRSTGSHLHYEVRIDGSAVNPMPFLQSSDYLLAMQKRREGGVALGGPIETAAAASTAR